jgi:hypothetical protein
MSNITTKFFSETIVESLKREIANDVYYFAIGRYTPWADENNPDTAYDTTDSINDFSRHLVAGKRIKSEDVTNLIPRYFWGNGNTYTQYDDTDTELFNKRFYVINSSEVVYKCLFNNGNTASTSEPTLVQNNIFQTADGYIWKYMYTISSSNNSKFSTGSYIPIEPNTTISSAAVNGAIDVVVLTNPGVGYTGYISGSVAQVVSNTLFRLTSTSALSVDSFYYNSSAFYIFNGTGEGQLTNISNYVVNGSGYYVYTEDALNSPALDATSEFRIAPQIRITGDGTGAKAICTVNTSTDALIGIDVISPGNNYSYANVQVIANPSYGSNATARAIIPPFGGHGYDAHAELGSKLAGFSVFFNNSESGSISTEVTVRQGGLIKAPKKYTKPALGNVAFNALTAVSNTDDTIAITNANTYFNYGDRVLYTTNTGNNAIGGLANNEYYYIALANTTKVKLSSNLDGTAINLTAGSSETGHRLYTTNTFSTNTFNALTTLTITTGLNTFTNSEIITGTTSGATARVGFANATVAKVVMVNDNFISNSTFGETIVGETSGVSATISTNGINNPDIEPFSFRVLHIDNVEYIQRSNTENEQGYLIITL